MSTQDTAVCAVNADANAQKIVGTNVDPFNIESLRLSQDFGSQIGVKMQRTRVPVRKPSRQEFIRVHPSPDYRLDVATLELKVEKETYLVMPGMRGELASELKPVRLFTVITRQNVVLLWPCTIPGFDGRSNVWHETALEAAALAQDHWVRVTSNMHLGAYETFIAVNDQSEPNWPEESFQDLLRIAFRDHMIDSVDHPVVAQLRGLN